MYDYLIVGAGIYGATCARRLSDKGYHVLVVEKKDHVGGNVYTECSHGIQVHKYGAHVFHSNDRRVWDFVRQFAEFNRYTNSPVANYRGELYSLPFNMYTFNRMWGVITPDEAAERIEAQRRAYVEQRAAALGINPDEFTPSSLEEQAISLVGTDIYEKLVKGYTEKQWGRRCSDLPSSIIRRLPVRLTFDNNYFNALFQGIPIGGFTRMIDRMLDGVEVRTGVDYLDPPVRLSLEKEAAHVIYTGAIDAFYYYKLGYLEYRSLRFEEELIDKENYQGNAVVNYTDADTPYTRIVEHKWFEFGRDADGNAIPVTIISREYSLEWKPGTESYYPIGDAKNNALYAKYRELADAEERFTIGGRLGEYRYYDMDVAIARALEMTDRIPSK